MGDWLEEGKKFPKVTMKNELGESVKVADHEGQYVVVYFYPKDNTPGCTREACEFRDQASQFKRNNAVVYGVSPDDVESHKKFSDKFDLNFSLLVDKDHKVAEKLGSWREKNMYGKKFMGIVRSTFLIAPDGKVAKVWKKVKVDGHADAVLDALKAHKKAQKS